MNVSRAAVRVARPLARRAPVRASLRQVRAESNTSSSTAQNAAVGGSSGLVGGIAGGGIVFAALYGYYHFSGAKSMVDTASATKKKYNEIVKTMQQKTPEPNELLKWFRQTATAYAAFIPGAKTYVDAAFNDLDTIEQNHRGEVNEIVSNAYTEMKEVLNKGISMDTAQQSWQVLQKYLSKLADLASDSASEILDNHPELKDKIGGNVDQLKDMANSYGPEAKKALEDTYSQIKDVLLTGVSAANIDKVRQIVQEKVDQVKKMGDEAWKKGLEQAKPFLDKNPEIKEQIEKNADVLKQGNISELYNKVKEGNTKDISQYVKQAVEKVKGRGKGMSSDIEKYAKMIPGGSEILPKLSQLQDVAQEHGDEAKKILKETYEEIKNVLQKRVEQVEKLGKEAKEDAKK